MNEAEMRFRGCERLSDRYPPAMRFQPSARHILASASVAACVALLAACGNSTGGHAPSPAAYEPPAKEALAAKDPKFRPIVQAILAQRKASRELADYRAGFGTGGMDEAAGAKYQQLFAKVADAGQKVSDLVAAAGFEGDDRRVLDVIVSMNEDQLKSLLN
jgi:hypothetical protein